MSALYGTYARSPLAFERGEGVRLISQDGTRYLDFHAGIAVNALGYGDPHLVKTMKEAAEKVWHTSNVFTIPEQERLGQRLVEHTFADSCFFTNSGAEALECAIKTARHYFWAKGETERYEILAFTGSFHGRTLGTIAAAGNPHYVEGFGPPLEGFKHIKPNDLSLVEAAITPKTCGILIEPVQGEGGVTAMSADYMRGLRALCDKHGMLLILDEVQCGYGRTGKMWGYEHYGVTPDIMSVAKGIGGGFPLGACLATEEAAKGMVFGTHGSTYGGNPLAIAAGEAVLGVIQEPGFLEHVTAIGERIRAGLEQMIPNHDHLFESVRGKGLMLGLRLKMESRDFVAHLRDNHGLLTVAAGDNVVRILPPLIIDESHVAEFFEKLSAGARSYEVKAS